MDIFFRQICKKNSYKVLIINIVLVTNNIIANANQIKYKGVYENV